MADQLVVEGQEIPQRVASRAHLVATDQKCAKHAIFEVALALPRSSETVQLATPHRACSICCRDAADELGQQGRRYYVALLDGAVGAGRIDDLCSWLQATAVPDRDTRVMINILCIAALNHHSLQKAVAELTVDKLQPQY